MHVHFPSTPTTTKKKIFVLYSIEYRNINNKYVYTFLKNDPQAAALLLFYAKGTDKRNCANEPLKPLNGCGRDTMGPKNAALDKGWPLPHNFALQ